LNTDLHLPPDEKLSILQVADLRRKWHSLDDQRVCVLCGCTITGRQIEVKKEQGGSYSVRCPTAECPAEPSDWFYQGNGCAPMKSASFRTGEATMWSA
jgi:hypothetical protein